MDGKAVLEAGAAINAALSFYLKVAGGHKWCNKVYMPIPLELITMLGGSVTGFVFRFMAERAKDRQEQFKMMMDRHVAEDKSRDDAVNRVPLDAGKWVRRAIVVSVLFGVILAPFILSILGYSTIVEIEEEKSKYFFGLFGGGIEKKFVEMQGYLIVPEVRQTLSAIVGFYFGSATASCKS